MFARLAQLAIGRPRAILAATLLLALFALSFGATAPAHLKGGGFYPHDAESQRAGELLEQMGRGSANLLLLVEAPGGADATAARVAGQQLVAHLQQQAEVSNVTSYWTAPPQVAPTLKSRDGATALITAHVAGDDSVAPKRAIDVVDGLPAFDGVTVRPGGAAVVLKDVNDQITQDLLIAEAVAIPITAVALIWIFGSVVAALLPLTIGLFAIVATLGILRLFTTFTDVSAYALNMTTAMGLALAVDYSLFIVSRYREELTNGLEPRAAVARTVQTAGRTVVYSALTVALSMAALAVFPVFFLRSFAYAGIAVVATAAAAAVLALPAALLLLGTRVNAWDLRKPLRRWFRRPEPQPVPITQSGWYRIATFTMRRAVPVALIAVTLLLFLGAPFLSARFGYPDDRIQNDTTAQSRVVGDALRADFAQNAANAITVVLPGNPDPAALRGYAESLSRVEGVTGVISAAGSFAAGQNAPAPPGMSTPTGTFLLVGTSEDPFSPAGSTQLDRLESVPAPGDALFTGSAAVNRDVLAALAEPLPLALGLIVVTTFVLLFLFTGSIVLPLKALVVNALSLTAAFGAMVWVFQEGNLSGLLGFTTTGYLIANMPILMFCVAFGLSMDYEVFLLSRIREEWVRTGDNTEAVALGLARTGRIITAVAALMAIVFVAIVTSKIIFMQLFALGLTLMVITDATVVRAFLVPALMKLLGRFNWWAPGPLRRLHDRIGISEEPIGKDGTHALAEPPATGPRPARIG